MIETSEALTDVLGEDGVSRKIVDDICDCLALDAIQRIQATETTATDVCHQMQTHLKYENLCSIGLARLVKIVKANVYNTRLICQEILAADGLEIILTSMSTHIATADIQGNGCRVLRELTYCSTDMELDNVMMATLCGARGVRTFLGALEHSKVQAEAFSAICQLEYLLDSSASEEFLSSLVEGGAIPLIFSSLDCNAEHSSTVTSTLNILRKIGFSSRLNIQRALQCYKRDHLECRIIIEHAVNRHPTHMVVDMLKTTILSMLSDYTEDEE